MRGGSMRLWRNFMACVKRRIVKAMIKCRALGFKLGCGVRGMLDGLSCLRFLRRTPFGCVCQLIWSSKGRRSGSVLAPRLWRDAYRRAASSRCFVPKRLTVGSSNLPAPTMHLRDLAIPFLSTRT